MQSTHNERNKNLNKLANYSTNEKRKKGRKVVKIKIQNS